MFVLKNDQVKVFFEEKINRFAKGQVKNLRDRQPKEVEHLDDLKLAELLKGIIKWGVPYGISTEEGLEYLINIIIKYGISEEFLNKNETVEEIFSFPDRTEENKLFLFHHYAEYGTVYEE